MSLIGNNFITQRSILSLLRHISLLFFSSGNIIPPITYNGFVAKVEFLANQQHRKNENNGNGKRRNNNRDKSGARRRKQKGNKNKYNNNNRDHASSSNNKCKY